MSSTLGTKLFTLMHGRFVGRDEFGNRYFESKRIRAGERSKRWVMYEGLAEPSKVPASWHGWLHHTIDAPLQSAGRKYPWQKPHLPNLTGTTGRYLPAGHITKGGSRAPAAADYEPWTPQ